MEDPLSRFKHSTCLLLASVLVLSGCDRLGEIIIVPEFDLTYSFEGSLDGWMPGGADLDGPLVDWSIAPSSEVVSTGSGAAKLHLDNRNGRAKVWLEQQFIVEPERAYEVVISLDLASSESGEAWRVIAGAHSSSPDGSAALTVQDATTPASSFEFTERSYTVQATSDEEGALFVVIGLWGTSVDDRVYYVDNVRLVLTRAN